MAGQKKQEEEQQHERRADGSDAAAVAAAAAAAPPTSAAQQAGDGDARTQKERMLAGDLYYAFEPQLTAERQAARRLLREFNALDDEGARLGVLARLVGKLDADDPPFIEPPFRCDYVSGGGRGGRDRRQHGVHVDAWGC